MIHDEIDFVSLEHPLAQGVIDFETGLSHGAIASCIWQNSGMRGLLMQYNFLVELPVLEEWGVADIAGPKYVSVVIDSKGTDLSNLVEQLQGAQFKDVGVPQGNSAVDMTLKFFAKEGFAAARRIAMVSAKEYAESASAAVEARCEQEYQRMNHLLCVARAVTALSSSNCARTCRNGRRRFRTRKFVWMQSDCLFAGSTTLFYLYI